MCKTTPHSDALNLFYSFMLFGLIAKICHRIPLDDIMIVSESLPSRPLDSQEAADEKELSPLVLLRQGVTGSSW